MKRFILESLLFCLLLSAILIIGIKALPRNPDNSFYANIPKLELVKTVSQPRAIFVGGSNLGFGLNSQKLSETIGKNVINLGLQAGLGLKFKIDEIDPYLRRGDLVVICPEYTHFYGTNAYGGPSSLPVLAEVRPGIVKDFNLQQWKTIVSGIPKMFGSRIAYMKSLFANKKGTDVYEERASNYDPKTGDELLHLTAKSEVEEIPTPLIKGNFNEDFLTYFTLRMKNWQSRGITVVMLPPAYYDKGFNLNRGKIDNLTKRLAESGYPFAASPEDFTYPRRLIYNTHYHLNKEGRELHTQSIAKILESLNSDKCD